MKVCPFLFFGDREWTQCTRQGFGSTGKCWSCDFWEQGSLPQVAEGICSSTMERILYLLLHLTLVFPLPFPFPTSSVCPVFSAFLYVCFPWDATNLMDGLSWVLQQIHCGAGCAWHRAGPGLFSQRPALQPTTCHGHPALGKVSRAGRAK